MYNDKYLQQIQNIQVIIFSTNLSEKVASKIGEKLNNFDHSW